MKTVRSLLLLSVLGVASPSRRVEVARDIELEGDAIRGRFQFTPARVSAAPGDVLRFLVRNGAPHLIAFDSTGLSSARRHDLNEAMPGRSSELRGPLLTTDGATYLMTVPTLPPGDYRFFCLSHYSRQMFGILTVQRGR